MRRAARRHELPYRATARLADNLLVLRLREGHSQAELAERAMVPAARISELENGRVGAQVDTYLRLAGALAISLDELLAGVTWVPAAIEREIEAGYRVDFGDDP